ncbi:MAG: GNAT family N-acetyltransferase [Cellulomonas sp.]
MRIDSLGFRTDLMLLSLQGSFVEDRGDHLVVRSPSNPGYWWGNFLLLRDPPAPGTRERWERAFASEFPAAGHFAFGVDGTSGNTAGYTDFTATGYEVEASAVMTATAVHEPAHPNREANYRALDLADPGDRESAIALRLANAPRQEAAGHREFLARSMDSMAALQVAGAGAWFGAFLGTRMVSGLGLFSDGSGLARFQSVDTHPDFRGRGLAGTLVHHVSTYGFTTLGATTLVMVADPGYHAIRVYRSVGFETSELQVQLEREPLADSSDRTHGSPAA